MTADKAGFREIAGARLYYEIEGSGPTVTMIHAGVAHLRMWDEQVAALRDRYRVVRYDTRGFGRTVTQDVPYSNVEDLRSLLDGLDIEETHLVGLSRGGMIALDFTIAHPDRVRSLTWVAGGVRGLDVPDDPRLVQVWPDMERLQEAHDWESLVELETQVWTDGPGQPADRIDPEIRRQMVEWNLENYRADQPADQVIPSPPVADRLSEIRVPTLVMWGTFDESSVGESGEYLAANVQGARKKVFEGVAHMVNLERPTEFNDLLGGFLDGVEAATSEGS